MSISNKNRIRCAVLLCMTCLLFFSCGGRDSNVTVLKMGHGLSPTHSVHVALVYMNKRINELSGGKMRIDIYPSAQLGSENQCIELLQIGSLDLTKVNSAALEGFADDFRVFGIPYLFKSREHFFKVLDGPVGQRILDSTQPYWFKGLAYFDSGARSFYTTDKAIYTPADLKGLKIRVQKSPIAVEMMQTFGGSATPVDYGELYTALQSHVVDGAENNAPSITTAYHHEVIKYYTINEHTMCPDVIIISSATWKKLNPQERGWLKQAAYEASLYQRKLWAKQEKEAMDIIKAKGVKIIYPDKQKFIEAAQPMLDRYRKNPKYSDLIEQIENADKENH